MKNKILALAFKVRNKISFISNLKYYTYEGVSFLKQWKVKSADLHNKSLSIYLGRRWVNLRLIAWKEMGKAD